MIHKAEKASKAGIFGNILKSLESPSSLPVKYFCLKYRYANVHVEDSDDWAERTIWKNKGRKTVHHQQLALSAFSHSPWGELRNHRIIRVQGALEVI